MPMQTYTPDYKIGQANYEAIEKAFDETNGLPYIGMSRWWRSPAQWRDFQSLQGVMSRGWPTLIRTFGKDHLLWDQQPTEIPLFGPFTGAQHEFGGNAWLAAACQMAGMTADDLGQWLLWADYRRRPAVYV